MTLAISRVLVLVAAFAGALAAGCSTTSNGGRDIEASDQDAGANGMDAQAPDSNDAGRGPDLLIGTWAASGPGPNIPLSLLTLSADKAFTFWQKFVPATTPAGFMAAGGCTVSQTILGTYVETMLDGTSALTWTFTSGSGNDVAGCDDVTINGAGAPIDAGGIDLLIDEGRIPPKTVIYSATATTLVLNPNATANTGNFKSRYGFTKTSD